MATIMRVGGGAGGGGEKAKTIGSLDVGTLVTVIEDGMPVKYRIVHQGIPSNMYDESCNGSWVVREELESLRAWDDADNNYAYSLIHEYLNGDFLNRFGSETRELIKQVKIPYYNGGVISGANGLLAKVFLLSGRELGFPKGTAQLPEDGEKLSYFNQNGGADPLRVAYLNGVAQNWWTRTANLAASYTVWNLYSTNGGPTYADCKTAYGIRPTFLFSQSAKISNNPSDDGSYALLADIVEDVYGIARDITASSPAWARTDGAIPFTAKASVGTAAGYSDFDNIYPWSEMKRVTLDSGDVMVRIPKFYYGRYRNGNIERIQISGRADVGLTLHPAFNHAGVEQECIYVGAYKTSAQYTSEHKSVSGDIPLVSGTRATFRAKAKEKGAGWSMLDISTLSAIQMLYLVEFANNNSQAMIGRGYVDGNSAAINTGSCDVVPNLTGRPTGIDGKTDIVYRGIEGLWGNIWEFVDGFNCNGGVYHACNDPYYYADSTTTGYKELSYIASNASGVYVQYVGLDTKGNSHIMIPSDTSSKGSGSTYYCDAYYCAAGWKVLITSGGWSQGDVAGLFTANMSNGNTIYGNDIGSRLIYIPQGGAQ